MARNIVLCIRPDNCTSKNQDVGLALALYRVRDRLGARATHKMATKVNAKDQARSVISSKVKPIRG